MIADVVIALLDRGIIKRNDDGTYKYVYTVPPTGEIQECYNRTNYTKFNNRELFEEYQSGNFDCEGNRVISLLEWKSKRQEPEMVNKLFQDGKLSEWYALFDVVFNEK